MSSINLSTEPRAAGDADLVDDVLHLLGQIGLSRDEATTFVEMFTGHPRAACTPAELLPMLEDLLALTRRTAGTGRRFACGA